MAASRKYDPNPLTNGNRQYTAARIPHGAHAAVPQPRHPDWTMKEAYIPNHGMSEDEEQLFNNLDPRTRATALMHSRNEELQLGSNAPSGVVRYLGIGRKSR